MKNRKSRHEPASRRKGQTNITDLLIAILAFVAAFVVFIILSDRSARDAFLASNFNEVTINGITITEAFIGNGGIPIDWESDPGSVQSIGLVEDQNNIDLDKLSAFVSMDYNISKTKMGLQPNIDYHFQVLDSDGVVLYESGTEPADAKGIFPFSRDVIISGGPGEMRLVLYD